ncbi:hypothetical protein HHK36_032416 [Tetracentron sinense]|uniref:DUF4283 domain-containing protein n=1 Tax=Tetracentron sinense TaxID=13715 RepID=A0A834Y970_TETSI|nr:hypothetical protein HHK36_032416 [Tetracentron sinense]
MLFRTAKTQFFNRGDIAKVKIFAEAKYLSQFLKAKDDESVAKAYNRWWALNPIANLIGETTTSLFAIQFLNHLVLMDLMDNRVDVVQNQLSITNLNVPINIVPSMISEGQKEFKHSIIGKLISDRPINKAAAKRTTISAWNSAGPVITIDLENYFTLFKFTSESEVDRVMNHQPWSFNGHPFLLMRWKPDIIIAELILDTLPLWVQVHRLPLEYQNSNVGKVIAGRLGDLEDVDLEEVGANRDSQLHLTIMASLNSTSGEGDQVILSGQLFLPLREVSDLFASSQSAVGASDLAASTTPAKGLEGLGTHDEIRKMISDVKNSEDEKRRLQIEDFSFSPFMRAAVKNVVRYFPTTIVSGRCRDKMLIYEFIPNATLWAGFLMVVAPKTTQGLVESLQETQELMIALQGTQELVKAPQRDSRAGGSSTRDLGACISFTEDSRAGGSHKGQELVLAP